MDSYVTTAVGFSRPRRGTAPLARKWIGREIRDRIATGVYPSGTKLVQQRLSKEFGAGAGSVREALFELEQFGMVETVDRVGVFVTTLGPELILAAYEVREVIEGLSARLACGHASSSQIKQLRKLLSEISQSDADGAAKLDREFHQQIITMSNNPILMRTSRSYRMLGKVVNLGTHREVTNSEHETILDAIGENRPEDAERSMLEHIRRARLEAEELIKQGIFEFHWVVD